METAKVGIREFRQDLAEYIASSTPVLPLGIRIAYALIPFALWISAMLVLRYYTLGEAQFDDIKRAIATARAGQTDAVG